MEAIALNFGMNGQEYDDFLCLGRKCKKRKAERHKVRMAKREAKTDERRAETERIRAETRMMQAMAPRPAPAPPANAPAPNAVPNIAQSATPPPAKAGMSNQWIILAAVLLVGGFLYTNAKKKPANPLADAGGQPALTT